METIEKIDCRRLSLDEIYALRKAAVRLKKQGYKAVQIEQMIGFNRNKVSEAWSFFKKNGYVEKPKTRGRKAGENKLLTDEQEKTIKKLIVDKTPDQLKFDCFLWDLKSVQGLIKDKFGIVLGKETVREYLISWGMSSQRPSKRAYKQSAEKVEEFKNSTFPEIQKRAKAENAEIFFGDETGIYNTAFNPRGYAPKGQTPVVRVEVKREKVNVMAAISMNGHRKFIAYEDKTNSDKVIQFMTQLIRDQKRRKRKKVFLFLDNLPVHHSKPVKKFLEQNKDKIEVFYFPSYSPDLNPQELLNNVLKQNIRSGKPPRNKEQIQQRLADFIAILKPKKIKNLFNHPKISFMQSA